MLEKARMPEFPKNSLKEFEVEGKKKFYTSYLHFFESVEIVNDSEQKIGFKCMFCPVKKSCCIGATSNLLPHLRSHRSQSEDLYAWLKIFADNKQAKNKIS